MKIMKKMVKKVAIFIQLVLITKKYFALDHELCYFALCSVMRHPWVNAETSN